MKEYYCDLQLHGLYAAGVSNKMLIPVLAEQSRLKGTNVLVSADCIHEKWLAHTKENLVETENGVFSDKGEKTFFIIGTEIEDDKRIHHLIYLPDISAAETLREKLKKYGHLDCSMCGRPKLSLTAEQVAQKVDEAGGIIGPAHSFTPYTGIYAHFDSVKQAYGTMAEKILFIELGLSADTELADTILENHKYAFLSSSDAHSPWPNKLGREFNKIKMQKPDFKSLKKALSEREEKSITLNAGLDPREGKYHKSACNACFKLYSHAEAKALFWKCSACTGAIKRGVRDRIEMLADRPLGEHPEFRPPYLHIIPLSEIIQIALDIKNANAQSVQENWKKFVNAFGTEINVLVETPENELLKLDQEIGKKIISFRKGFVSYIPGGGGNYGKPFIFDSEQEFLEKKDRLEEIEKAPKKNIEQKKHETTSQKKLFEFLN